MPIFPGILIRCLIGSDEGNGSAGAQSTWRTSGNGSGKVGGVGLLAKVFTGSTGSDESGGGGRGRSSAFLGGGLGRGISTYFLMVVNASRGRPNSNAT